MFWVPRVAAVVVLVNLGKLMLARLAGWLCAGCHLIKVGPYYG